MSGFYDLSAEKNNGEEFSFADLKGKKVMIVNTASACGFTPQYETLQELYAEFGGDNFEVIAFPSNDFGAQEPGSDAEIQEFCSLNFQTTFPLMKKTPVNGDNQHAVYRWLTSADLNGAEDVSMDWNFRKFLIDEDGNWVKTLSPTVSPADEQVLDWLSK